LINLHGSALLPTLFPGAKSYGCGVKIRLFAGVQFVIHHKAACAMKGASQCLPAGFSGTKEFHSQILKHRGPIRAVAALARRPDGLFDRISQLR